MRLLGIKPHPSPTGRLTAVYQCEVLFMDTLQLTVPVGSYDG